MNFTIRQVRDCPLCLNYSSKLGNAEQWKKHSRQWLKKSGKWTHETHAGKALHGKLIAEKQ